ncbi:MAG: hypothetical protein ABI234_10020 [Ktedonobacteraceae bacterium]
MLLTREHAFQRQQLKLRQIDCQRLHLRPILRWCIHSDQKMGGGDMLTRC